MVSAPHHGERTNVSCMNIYMCKLKVHSPQAPSRAPVGPLTCWWQLVRHTADLNSLQNQDLQEAVCIT